MMKEASQMPCFRKSFLTGIPSGIGVGIAYFLFTSKLKKAQHVAFGSYMVITFGTWCVCRYQHGETKEREKRLKEALRMKIQYEGTEMEKKILSQADAKN